MSAEQGDAAAQEKLATLYDQGVGLKQDWLLALMWYEVAVASGQSTASKARDVVASRLLPAQQEEGKFRAVDCRARQFKSCD
jgi:hypothetical protein